MIVSLHDKTLAANVTRVETLPGELYSRTSPRRVYYCDSDAERSYANYYRKVNAKLRQQSLYRITDAVVRGLGIITLNDAIIAENLVGIQNVATMERWVNRVGAPQQTIDEPVLYLTRVGVRNFGHCLTDILPRLHWFHERYPEVKIIIHKEMRSVILEALKLLGIRESKLVMLGNEITKLKAMYFLDQWNDGPLVHSGKIFVFLNRLKNLVVSSRQETRDLPRKLFITRTDASSRHIANHDEVARLLRESGFTEITLGNMSLEDQIWYFAAADCVVGIAGAAMSAIAFCRPGTNIVNLSPSTLPAFYFWDMAHHAGLIYDIAYFPPLDKTKGQAADFLVDIGVLERLISI